MPKLPGVCTAVIGRAFLPVRVLALVVGQELAVFQWTPPVFVLPVPLDRGREALVEGNAGRPPERARFGTIDRVAPIVSFAVRDVLHVRLRGTPACLDQPARQIDVAARVASADVIDLAEGAVR